jgi:hypothetical protein
MPRKPANRDNHGRDVTLLVDQNVVDIADSCCPMGRTHSPCRVGHGGPFRHLGVDAGRPRARGCRLLGEGRDTDNSQRSSGDELFMTG